MTNSFDTIIWDWNGTLLNDLDICIRCMNRLLERREMKLLEKERYREIFTFPVKEYYQAAGFDFQKEAFEIPAEEFIREYNLLLSQATLFDDVISTLEHFRQQQVRQYIVSAMEQKALLQSVNAHGLSAFFGQICGIENNLAHSKVHRAQELIQKENLDPAQVLLIGDTLHDHEVACHLGVEVALISRGHQCHTRLKVNGNVVFASLQELTLRINQ